MALVDVEVDGWKRVRDPVWLQTLYRKTQDDGFILVTFYEAINSYSISRCSMAMDTVEPWDMQHFDESPDGIRKVLEEAERFQFIRH